jgi:signal peptidase I
MSDYTNSEELRRPIVALVLSILTVGLGQLYSTRHRRALLFYGAFLVLSLLYISTPVFYSYVGLVVACIAAISFNVFQVVDAWRTAKKVGVTRLRRYNRRSVYVLIVVVHCLVVGPLILRAVPVKAYRTPTDAMEPSLLEGDFFYVDRVRYLRDGLKRGDVVVFSTPTWARATYIKRVIGLPGETVGTFGSQVWIDGVRLGDPWGTYKGGLIARPVWGPAMVPEGAYFVLGDNRDNSYDSRAFGCVKLSSIRGKALYIYWARDMGRIGKQVR